MPGTLTSKIIAPLRDLGSISRANGLDTFAMVIICLISHSRQYQAFCFIVANFVVLHIATRAHS